MAKGVNIPLTISGLRQAREDLEALDNQLEKVDKRTKEGKKLDKQFNDLSAAIDDTTKSLIDMNSAGDLAGTKFDDLNEVLFQTSEEVLPLTSQIGEMEDRMYQLAQANQQGSKEFKVLQEKVVNARKVIIETDRSIDTMAENAGSIGGISSAFGELGESVVNLDFKRAGVALKGLGTQFKAFGATLLANPIFLIVAVIAAVVTAVVTLRNKVKFLGDIFDFFAGIVTDAVQALKDFADWIGITDFAEQGLAEERKNRAQENLDNINKQATAQQSDFDRKIALASAEGKATVELEVQKQEAIIATNLLRREQLIAIIKAETILGEITKERANELKAQAGEIGENVKNAVNQIKILEAGAKKERNANYQARKADKDAELAEDKARIEELNAFKEQAELDWMATEEELSEIIYQAGLTAQEKEELTVKDKYFNLIELAKQHNLDVTALEEEKQMMLKSIDDKYLAEKQAKEDALDKEKEDKDKADVENAQAVEAAKLDFVSDGLNLASQVTDLFGKKSEAAAKKAFQVQKAISIAQAVMDTYKGANAIFAAAAANPASILFPAQPFITAGLAIAGGIANVAKISQTKFQGGNSTGGGGGFSAPSVGGGGATSTAQSSPSFELFGQPNEDNNVSATQSQEAQAMTVTAVVVESDITSTQNKVNKMQKNAEL